MTFGHARCDLCGNSYFKERHVFAFEYDHSSDPLKLRKTDLKGRQPWTGIRIVCLNCVGVIGHVALDIIPDEMREQGK